MDNKGFTLVELIAVLIITGIVFTIVAVKFMNFSTTAEIKMVDQVIAELNTREKHTWLNAKLDGSDPITYKIDLDIGKGTVVVDKDGNGTITINSTTKPVYRKPSTMVEPGIWRKLE